MHNVELMKVRNAANDIFEESTCLKLIEFGVCDDIIEQFSIFDILHDEKEMLGSLYDLIELNDAGVPDQF